MQTMIASPSLDIRILLDTKSLTNPRYKTINLVGEQYSSTWAAQLNAGEKPTIPGGRVTPNSISSKLLACGMLFGFNQGV